MTKTSKIIFGTLIAVVLGAAIGIASAIAGTYIASAGLSVRNGPWHASLATGTPQADPYTRAFVALHGLLALNPSEVIYYNAYTDDDGMPLQAGCTYRIEGKTLEARWWSITAYGPDDYLIPNDLNRYSYSSTTVPLDANGNFVIHVSKTRQSGAWLPLGDASGFSLTLRLYNPGAIILDHPAIVELPHIIKESCQ